MRDRANWNEFLKHNPKTPQQLAAMTPRQRFERPHLMQQTSRVRRDQFFRSHPQFRDDWQGVTLEMVPLIEQNQKIRINMFQRKTYLNANKTGPGRGRWLFFKRVLWL